METFSPLPGVVGGKTRHSHVRYASRPPVPRAAGVENGAYPREPSVKTEGLYHCLAKTSSDFPSFFLPAPKMLYLEASSIEVSPICCAAMPNEPSEIEFLSPRDFFQAVNLIRKLTENAQDLDALIRLNFLKLPAVASPRLERERELEVVQKASLLMLWVDAARTFLRNAPATVAETAHHTSKV